MRFLIDNALSPVLAKILKDAGHDSVHLRDYGMQAAGDDLVFDRADAEDRILISADTDFSTVLAVRQVSRPSIILFRKGSDRRPEKQAATILVNLGAIKEELSTGSVVVFEESRIRIRRLPIGGSHH